MEKVQGKVLSVSLVKGERRALLEVERQAICARCAAGKGCGAAVFGGEAGSRQLHAVIASGIDVREGQLVEIAMQSGDILRAAGTVYGLPMLGALVGAAAGWGLELGDVAAAGMAMAGLAVGFGVARRRLRQEGCLRHLTPAIIAAAGDT
jgi:sigma-E factor negative regulatory protein RseC